MGQPSVALGIPYDQSRSMFIDTNNNVVSQLHRHRLRMAWTGRDLAAVYISDTHHPRFEVVPFRPDSPEALPSFNAIVSRQLTTLSGSFCHVLLMKITPLSLTL